MIYLHMAERRSMVTGAKRNNTWSCLAFELVADVSRKQDLGDFLWDGLGRSLMKEGGKGSGGGGGQDISVDT